MVESKNAGMRVAKKCPNCGWRVLDKISPASGKVEIKCSRCGKAVTIDLSFRMAAAMRYRAS